MRKSKSALDRVFSQIYFTYIKLYSENKFYNRVRWEHDFIFKMLLYFLIREFILYKGGISLSSFCRCISQMQMRHQKKCKIFTF